MGLKVEINLCEKDGWKKGLCSPTLLVTEDDSDDRLPIILPEDIDLENGKWMTEKLKEIILKNHSTVAEVREEMYGNDE